MKENVVIIIARNNMHLTRRTLKSALAQDIPTHVLVFDNASNDGTLPWLRAVEATHPNVSFLVATKQISLSAAWNKCLKYTWMCGHEFALVLNNDVVLLPHTYSSLIQHGGDFVTTVSVDTQDQFDAGGSTNYRERPHPNFSGFLIRKSCWEKVGPFDESYYPAYCEDSDYHVRMHRAGVNAVCIDLPTLHLGNGANTLRSASVGERARIKRGADENRERFRKKYGCLPGSPEYEALFT